VKISKILLSKFFTLANPELLHAVLFYPLLYF